MLYLGLQISSWSSPCSFLHFPLKPISSSHHIKLFLTFDIDPRFVVSVCLCICCSCLAISAFAIFIFITPAVLFKPCLGHHLFWKTCIKILRRVEVSLLVSPQQHSLIILWHHLFLVELRILIHMTVQSTNYLKPATLVF